MDEWGEMDEWEAWDEMDAEAMKDAAAGAQGENDADAAMAEIADLDRTARKDGAKLANEWERRDFQSLLNNHKELRILDLGELRALFLVPVDLTEKGICYRRGNIRDVRRNRANGGKPLYRLADAPIDVDLAAKNPAYARGLALLKEQEKLDEIWEKL